MGGVGLKFTYGSDFVEELPDEKSKRIFSLVSDSRYIIVIGSQKDQSVLSIKSLLPDDAFYVLKIGLLDGGRFLYLQGVKDYKKNLVKVICYAEKEVEGLKKLIEIIFWTASITNEEQWLVYEKWRDIPDGKMHTRKILIGDVCEELECHYKK